VFAGSLHFCRRVERTNNFFYIEPPYTLSSFKVYDIYPVAFVYDIHSWDFKFKFAEHFWLDKKKYFFSIQEEDINGYFHMANVRV